jgi:predicted CoA-binding protein
MESSLVKKLLIKPGYSILLTNAPTGYREELGTLPDGAKIVEAPQHEVDMVQLFVSSKAELHQYAQQAIDAVKKEGLLWICYPKGSTKAKLDINRDILWNEMAPYHQTGVTLIAINATWSAMRFRPQ